MSALTSTSSSSSTSSTPNTSSKAKFVRDPNTNKFSRTDEGKTTTSLARHIIKNINPPPSSATASNSNPSSLKGSKVGVGSNAPKQTTVASATRKKKPVDDSFTHQMEEGKKGNPGMPEFLGSLHLLQPGPPLPPPPK